MEGHFGRGQVVFKFSFQRTVILLWLILNTKKKNNNKKNYIIHINIMSIFKCLSFVKTDTWLVHTYIDYLIILKVDMQIFASLYNLYPYYFRKEMER